MTERTYWTPGPWTNDGGLVTGRESRPGKSDPSLDIFDANQWPMALTDEAHANADLIAAAPDLYEALDIVLDALGALSNPSELHGWMSEESQIKVFAARKKARGQTR